MVNVFQWCIQERIIVGVIRLLTFFSLWVAWLDHQLSREGLEVCVYVQQPTDQTEKQLFQLHRKCCY